MKVVNGELTIENEDEKPDIQMQDEPLLTKMKQYILQQYEPVQNAGDADMTMTTEEIYQAIMNVYCNELLFTRTDLTNWLHAQGFTFYDAGRMQFEWLLKNASN